MRDSFALKKDKSAQRSDAAPDPAPSLADKIDAATAVLRAMS